MTKKVLLLFSQISVQQGMTHPQDLVRLLNDASDQIEAQSALLEDLVFHIDGPDIDVIDTTSGQSLSTYDAVYFRYWGMSHGPAIAAARYCKLKGIPFVDREVLRVGSHNKITQYVNLFEAGVPIPKTLIGSAKYLATLYEQYGFSFPYIMKAVGGTRGQDNFLVRDTEQLQEICAKNPDTAFVMQSFLRNDRDYRVIVMGDNVVSVIERRAAGDSHLNNTSQGGAAATVPIETLPAEVREMSVRAAQFFGRDIAGVDIVQSLDDQQYYCFEVNRAPQIEHSSYEHEKAALLADYLTSL